MGLSCSPLKKKIQMSTLKFENPTFFMTRKVAVPGISLQGYSLLGVWQLLARQMGLCLLCGWSLHGALLPYSLRPSSVYLFRLCMNLLCLAMGQFWNFYKGRLYCMATLLLHGTQKSLVERGTASMSFLSYWRLGESATGWVPRLFLSERQRKWIVVAG